MTLQKLAGCSGGTCPAVYQTEHKSFVVQGKFLSPSVLKQLTLGNDETAVELPEEIVMELVAKLQK